MISLVRGLYFYYSTGATKQIAYFSTISALVLLVFLHILQAGIALQRFFGIGVALFPLPDVGRAWKYLLMFLYFAPIYIVLSWIFTKDKLAFGHLNASLLRRSRNRFFLYAIFNLLLLVALLSDRIRLN